MTKRMPLAYQPFDGCYKTQASSATKPPSPKQVYHVKSTAASTYWKSRSKHAKELLPPEFQPCEFTVICGRSKQCFDSTGNRRFRLTVKLFLEEYAEATNRSEKSAIVSRIYNLIKEASAVGSFVTYKAGRWYECSERIAREKIGACFRDFLHDNYKSSAKSKQAKRKISATMQDTEFKERQHGVAAGTTEIPIEPLPLHKSSLFDDVYAANTCVADAQSRGGDSLETAAVDDVVSSHEAAPRVSSDSYWAEV